MVIRIGGSGIYTDSMLKLIKLPDLLSVCNALFGFAAILLVLEGGSTRAQKTALVFILVATVIDGLDGFVARTVESSPIGRYLDSLADMVSFGVAPAVVAFVVIKSFSSVTLTYPQVVVVSAFCGAYMICGMLRLARYDAKISQQNVFVGLPITGSAILLASFMLLAVELAIPGCAYILVILMGILCLFMISRIQYRKLKNSWLVIISLILFSALFFLYAVSLSLFVYPAAIIVVLTALYIGSQVMHYLLNRE
ncbi:MAG: CDP-diacylglycerol--serine O-phosphatidyltransferase [Euryarchaeota archaeon]|nr:CDP-diacylglycerol--serine O-phosphatidyltransferase [Euryarchaeota archaeon]